MPGWSVPYFMMLMYVVAFPISIVLDRALGRDIGQVYSQAGGVGLLHLSTTFALAQ